MKTLGRQAFLLTAPFAFSLLTQQAWSARDNAVIIDAGADLAHPALQGLVNVNAAELGGQAGKDDDNDGLVDNVSGWNAVSNDGDYFPKYISEIFTEQSDAVTQLFDLYSKVEQGDRNAALMIQLNPDLQRALSVLLGQAHGTHVSGIVARNFSRPSRVQSINFFMGSQPGGRGEADLIFPLDVRRNYSLLRQTVNTLTEDAGEESFLSPATVQAIVAKTRQALDARLNVVSHYLKVTKPGAANLSLGAGEELFSAAYNALYKAELTQNGKDAETPRTAEQEKLFQQLIKGLAANWHDGFKRLFDENSDTVFVVAAGNDGNPTTADAGNTSVHPNFPSNLSVECANVITVAATNKDGVLADFSSYSKEYVTIGAWGTAVPSLAPGNHQVVMSGTSMAAPLVTGIVANIRATNMNLSAAQVRQVVERTGRKVASLNGKTTTGAAIDADAAFKAAAAMGNGSTLIEALGSVQVQDKILSTDHTAGQVAPTSELVRQMIRAL